MLQRCRSISLTFSKGKNMIIQQNWLQLTSIQVGAAICLPVFMIGPTLHQSYGFMSAVISIILGNAILLLLGLIAAKMSHENRKTTVENAMEYFGGKGVSFFAMTMALFCLGWFGIQLNMMSLGVLDLLSLNSTQSLTAILLNICLGLLITYVAFYGMKGINILADYSVPLLIATIGYAVFTVDRDVQASQPPLSIKGISLVIALAVGFVIDQPTYFRHAKTYKDGYISVAIIFGLALPMLEIVGVYLASGITGGSILDVLRRENAFLWNLWVAIFLVLAGWTTNNINLYTGVVSLANILNKSSERTRTLLFGGSGTLLACFDLLSHLDVVLDIMGVLISSMGAVIIMRYIIMQLNGPKLSSRYHKTHIFAWIVGIISGFSSMLGVSLTSIPILDAIIGASFTTCLILIQKERYEKAYIG
jgi:cytosine permease